MYIINNSSEYDSLVRNLTDIASNLLKKFMYDISLKCSEIDKLIDKKKEINPNLDTYNLIKESIFYAANRMYSTTHLLSKEEINDILDSIDTELVCLLNVDSDDNSTDFTKEVNWNCSFSVIFNAFLGDFVPKSFSWSFPEFFICSKSPGLTYEKKLSNKNFPLFIPKVSPSTIESEFINFWDNYINFDNISICLDVIKNNIIPKY